VRAGRPAAHASRLALAGTALFGAAAVWLAAYAWETLPHRQPLEELAYYPSGKHLGRVSLGHAETAADLAWLRAVQYYGEHRMTDSRFERMGHVFDILTSLDPRYTPAYVFGAFALAQEGRSFEKAEALMLKGIEANPTDGELAFELGFLYYIKSGGRDLERASEYFERAARLPGGPPQAAHFAAYARQHGGDLAMALALWDRVRTTTANAYLRELSERKMREILRAIESGREEDVMLKLTTPQVILLPSN
jgi:TPR repeat protein